MIQYSKSRFDYNIKSATCIGVTYVRLIYIGDTYANYIYKVKE